MKIEKLYMILCLIVGVTLSGCIEEYEADIPSEDTDLLVVEGTICSGNLNTFILSRSQAINSYDIRQMIMGAKVSVRGSDGSEYVAQEDPYQYSLLGGGGVYSCQIDALAPDVEYYLHIEIDGEVYESEPQKPLRTEEIADVRGVQNTPESNIDVLVTPDVPFESDKANYYSWTYDETWEVHPDYTTDMYFDTENMAPVFLPQHASLFPERGWKDAKSSTIMVGASLNYHGQQIKRLKIYDIDPSDERIFYMYSGLVHQRAISKGEYEYELARRQAGSEMGGLFTPQPSSLPTNIHCLTSNKHVIGFVGCSLNTSEYRFFLNYSDFTVQYPPRVDTRIWLEECNEEDCYLMVRRGLFLCEWEDGRLQGYPLRTAWAYESQLNVYFKGAYIEKPDFWKSY
jgi:hypothetical protein